MSYERASTADIDRKLSDDFRRRLKDYGYSAETNDPLLSVLFRSVAAQMERLSADAEKMRLALLDELIACLGVERRSARPAQTVVRFFSGQATALIPAGTELLAEAGKGDRFVFGTDAPVAISPARLALCAVYQSGQLRLLAGPELSEDFAAAEPSMEAVSANLGPAPALILAIENLGEAHLSRHGVFFETTPYAVGLREALRTETWCLARSDGAFAAEGILRPHRGNAGVQELHWLLRELKDDSPVEAGNSVPDLPDGMYGPRVFVFPSVPPDLRSLCLMPRGMEASLPRLFGRLGDLLTKRRAWIRISLPTGLTDAGLNIANVLLHAVSASNVECLNQTVEFARDGVSIPVSREAGTNNFLVAPLSVTGEFGETYLPDLSPEDLEGAGRYAIRNGRMVLRPAGRGEERADRYANIRLWVTTGAAANTVGPGQVQSFRRGAGAAGIRLLNPTAASGGWDTETASDAKARFAHVLLSRQRLITRADLVAAVRAFDHRIHFAEVSATLRRTPQGLERVHMISVTVDPTRFVDFERESSVLREELQAFLESRSLFDIPLLVRLVEAS